MSYKAPKTPAAKLPRQPSVVLTPPTPTSTPTKAKGKGSLLKVSSSIPASKKSSSSSPRSNVSLPPTPPVNAAPITPKSRGSNTPNVSITTPTTPITPTTAHTATQANKRPIPVIKTPIQTPPESYRLIEDDPFKKYKDVSMVEIFRFFERQLLSTQTPNEQDQAIHDKFIEAFKDEDNPAALSSWPHMLSQLKKKVNEPRELYTKQLQKMVDQVNSQVFVMNERLVSEIETREQLQKEVMLLRKQVLTQEEDRQAFSMLRRSLQINLQAAFDHLQVSTKLLAEDKIANDDEAIAYGKPETPREEMHKHEGKWPKQTQPTITEKEDGYDTADTSTGEGIREEGGEGQDGSRLFAERDIEREVILPFGEAEDTGRGGYEMEASEQKVRSGVLSGELVGEDDEFEFFV